MTEPDAGVVEYHLDLYAIERADEPDPTRRVEWRLDLETSGVGGRLVFDQAAGEWRGPAGEHEDRVLQGLLAALRRQLGVDV